MRSGRQAVVRSDGARRVAQNVVIGSRERLGRGSRRRPPPSRHRGRMWGPVFRHRREAAGESAASRRRSAGRTPPWAAVRGAGWSPIEPLLHPGRPMTIADSSRGGGKRMTSGALRRATSASGRDILMLSSLLALCVIGWEHAFHAFVLGVADEDSSAGHLGHALRDAFLSFPIALAAVAAGLALGRRFGPVVRALLISAVFGLLLVPSVRLHDLIDGALSGGSELEHHHHGGLEA